MSHLHTYVSVNGFILSHLHMHVSVRLFLFSYLHIYVSVNSHLHIFSVSMTFALITYGDMQVNFTSLPKTHCFISVSKII